MCKMNYFSARKLQELVYEIHDKYVETLNIFPINVIQNEIDEYNIVLKKKINMILRAQFLINALQQYWDFGNNKPGELYSLSLWKEMCSYGFRFGNPPCHCDKDKFNQNVSFTNLLFFKPSFIEFPIKEKYNDLKT